MDINSNEITEIYSNDNLSFSAANIKLWGSLADQHAYFQKDGINVCDLITYFYYTTTSSTPTRSSASWSTGIDCTETSRLQIEFRKE